MTVAGDERNIIVLRPGATSETNSAIRTDQVNKLKQLSEVARDPVTSEALISPEVMVQVNLPLKRVSPSVDGGTEGASKRGHEFMHKIGNLPSGQPRVCYYLGHLNSNWRL